MFLKDVFCSMYNKTAYNHQGQACSWRILFAGNTIDLTPPESSSWRHRRPRGPTLILKRVISADRLKETRNPRANWAAAFSTLCHLHQAFFSSLFLCIVLAVVSPPLPLHFIPLGQCFNASHRHFPNHIPYHQCRFCQLWYSLQIKLTPSENHCVLCVCNCL